MNLKDIHITLTTEYRAQVAELKQLTNRETKSPKNEMQ